MEEWEKRWAKLEEDEEDYEIEKIVESGERKIVSSDFYSDYFDPSYCRYCMNYNWKDDTCKVNSTYNYMAKDRGNCEEWIYIFKTKDEE